MPIYSNVAVPIRQLVSPTPEELQLMPFHRYAAFNITAKGDCQSNSFKGLHEQWVSLPKQVEWLRARGAYGKTD